MDVLQKFRIVVADIQKQYPDWSQKQIAEYLNVDRCKVQRAIDFNRKHGKSDITDGTKESIFREYGQDIATITTKSLNVKTVEGALEIAEADLEVWEVDRHIINSWEVTAIMEGEDGSHPETYTNWQVKVWLKRIIKKPLEIAIESILEKMVDYAPDYKPVIRTTQKDPHLLEVSIYDHHFALLAWAAETNNNYDLSIAKDIYFNAVVSLIERTRDKEIEEINFVLGQDIFHVNDQKNQTPRNQNSLDVDGRLAKVFETGEEAVIKAIEYCREVAPVKVLWVPGNHDPETSYYLCRVLKAWFRKDSEVTIDVTPTTRKYVHYGVNLIGFTHGIDEPEKSLPLIMADEKPHEWADSKFREWHIGHKHKKREMSFVNVDSWGSVSVRMIPSLCAHDAWHYRKGYVGGNRSAMAFLWSKTNGLDGSFLTHVKNQEQG